MKRRYFFRWTVILFLIIALVVSVVIHRDALLLRFAPKGVLAASLSDTMSELENRFQNHPFHIAAKLIDPNGKYTADVTLKTSNALIGPVRYDMTVHTNAALHQIFAEGEVQAADRDLDIKLYLDQNFAAVSSEDLIQGNYYGITYDTFDSDIDKIPLLGYFVSKTMLSQWNASIQALKREMSKNYTFPELPETTAEDFRLLLLGMIALPCDIEKTTVAVDNEYVQCNLLSYSASGEEVDKLLAGTPFEQGSSIRAKFYLLERDLIKLTLICGSENDNIHFSLNLAEGPNGPLSLQVVRSQSGHYEEYTVIIDTEQSQTQYAESWDITSKETKAKLDFTWDNSNGILELNCNDGNPVILQIKETETGLQMKTEDFQSFLNTLKGVQEENTQQNLMECSMVIRKGSEIVTPGYQNLDQWSIEDFLILLEGLGSLMGIKLN